MAAVAVVAQAVVDLEPACPAQPFSELGILHQLIDRFSERSFIERLDQHPSYPWLDRRGRAGGVPRYDGRSVAHGFDYAHPVVLFRGRVYIDGSLVVEAAKQRIGNEA